MGAGPGCERSGVRGPPTWGLAVPVGPWELALHGGCDDRGRPVRCPPPPEGLAKPLLERREGSGESSGLLTFGGRVA